MSDIMGRGDPNRKHLDGNGIKFYPFYKPNKEKTKEEGREIHDDADFIQITSPGGEVTCREVQDRDKYAYPEHWQAYEANRQPPQSGTNIAEWCIITPAQLQELNYMGFRTVEQVAGMSEEMTKQYPGLVAYQRQAINWLEGAKAKPNDFRKLKEQITELERKYNKLLEQYQMALKRIEFEQGGRLVSL